MYFGSTYDCDITNGSSLKTSPNKNAELGLKINLQNSKSEKRANKINRSNIRNET